VVDPSAIVVSGSWFSFDGTGYTNVTSVQQGHGYWVLANADGAVSLTCGSSGPSAKLHAAVAAHGEPPGFGSLRIEDASGGMRRLYFGGTLSSTVDPRSFSVPPLPPIGSFDARFSDATSLLQGSSGTIEVQSMNYPLRISLEQAPDSFAVGWILDELSPGGEVHVLEGDIAITVNNAEVKRFGLRRTTALDVAGWELPPEFAITGNYPNPFSDETALLVDMPEDGEIEIGIFDLLGRKVLRLPVATVAAGLGRRILVDGSNLPSGLYMYRVRATMSTRTAYATGKMTLLR
jgi:hypothetical protein